MLPKPASQLQQNVKKNVCFNGGGGSHSSQHIPLTETPRHKSMAQSGPTTGPLLSMLTCDHPWFEEKGDGWNVWNILMCFFSPLNPTAQPLHSCLEPTGFTGKASTAAEENDFPAANPWYLSSFYSIYSLFNLFIYLSRWPQPFLAPMPLKHLRQEHREFNQSSEGSPASKIITNFQFFFFAHSGSHCDKAHLRVLAFHNNCQK